MSQTSDILELGVKIDDLADIDKFRAVLGVLGTEAKDFAATAVDVTVKGKRMTATFTGLDDAGNRMISTFKKVGQNVKLVSTQFKSSADDAERLKKKFLELQAVQVKTNDVVARAVTGTKSNNSPLKATQDERDKIAAASKRVHDVLNSLEGKQLTDVQIDEAFQKAATGAGLTQSAVDRLARAIRSVTTAYKQMGASASEASLKAATSASRNAEAALAANELRKHFAAGIASSNVAAGGRPIEVSATQTAAAASAISRVQTALEKGVITLAEYDALWIAVQRDGLNSANATTAGQRQVEAELIKVITLLNQVDTQHKKVVAGNKYTADRQKALSNLAGQFDLSQATPQQAARFANQLATAVGHIKAGGVELSKFDQLLLNVTSKGTAGFAAVTQEELKAEGAIRQLLATADKFGQGDSGWERFTLSLANISRIAQIQLLHLALGQLTSTIQKATKEAAQLQIKISEVRTISQNAQLSTTQWSSALSKLSTDFNLPLLDVTTAAYEVLSNQIAKGAASTKFLSEAFEFARTTASSAVDSVNLLSSVINAYGFSVAETDKITSILFKTIDLGRIKATEMANTFGNVATLAHQMGVSFEDLNASLAVLTIQGIQYDTAATGMNNILLKLLKPSEAMKDLFDKWGVSSGKAAIDTYGFVGILQLLNKELANGGIEKLGLEFQDLRAIRGITGLVGEHTNAVEDFKNQTSGYGNAKEISKESDSLKVQQGLMSAYNATVTSLGTAIVSVGARITPLVTELVPAIQSLGEAVRALTFAWDEFLGPSAQFASSLGQLISPFKALRDALAQLGPESQRYEANLRKIQEAQSEQVKESLDSYKHSLNERIDAQVDAVNRQNQVQQKAFAEERKLATQAAKEFIGAEQNGLKGLINEVPGFFEAIKKENIDIEKDLDRLQKEGIKNIERSIQEIRKLDREYAKRSDSRSLVGANDLEQVEIMVQRIAELQHQVKFDTSNIEEARDLYGEIYDNVKKTNDLLDKQIDKSTKNIDDLRDDKERRAYERSVATLGVTQKVEAAKKRIADLTDKANKAALAGDFDRARAIGKEALGVGKEVNQDQERARKAGQKNFAKGLGGIGPSAGGLEDAAFDAYEKLEQRIIKIAKDRQLDEKKFRDERVDSEQKFQTLTQQQILKGKELEDGIKRIDEAARKAQQHIEDMVNALNKTRSGGVEASQRFVDNTQKLQALGQAVGGGAAIQKLLTVLNDATTTQKEAQAAQRQFIKEINASNLSDINKKKLTAIGGQVVDDALATKRAGSGKASDAALFPAIKADEIRNRTVDALSNLNEGQGYNNLYRQARSGITGSRTTQQESASLYNRTLNQFSSSLVAMKRFEDAVKGMADSGRQFTKQEQNEIIQKRQALKGEVSAAEAAYNLAEELYREAGGKARTNEQIKKAAGFAEGGYVFGPPAYGGGDNQIIKAKTGEFIVNSGATQMFYSELQMMNRGQNPYHVNIGDVNVHTHAQATPQHNVRAISYQLRRELRRGTIKLT